MENKVNLEETVNDLETLKEEKTKISAKEFSEKFTNAKIVAQKQALIEQANLQKYVPYIIKISTIKEVLKSICVEDGLFSPNSDRRYVSFNLMVVSLYTDIDIAEEDVYDTLKSSGVLNAILALIEEEEIKELQLLYAMIYDDMVQKYSSLEAIINKQSNRIGTICAVSLDRLAQAVEKLDVDKISKIVKERFTKK